MILEGMGFDLEGDGKLSLREWEMIFEGMGNDFRGNGK